MSISLPKRILLYIIGLVILAFGITLNVKTGLGVSPIISVSYAFSVILSLPIGDTTFILYILFVLAEIAIHIVLWKKGRLENLSRAIMLDVLQLPLSMLFTRLMNVYEAFIPHLSSLPEDAFLASLLGRLLTLLVAIAATGIGAALSLDMRLVPNPGDGIVQAIADASGKETGLSKNIFDGCNLILSASCSLLFASRVIGIGIGTVASFLGVGRVIAIFNRLFLPRLR